MDRTKPTTRKRLGVGRPSAAMEAVKPPKPARTYIPIDGPPPADETDGLTPIEHRRWLLAETMKAYGRARDDRSHVACRQMLRDAATLRDEIAAMERADAASSSSAVDGLTPDEWSATLRERAVTLTDDDLEVFVAEYLGRNKHVRLATG